MKKSHLVLLAVTVITAILSAYSLAAINYIYKLDYQWYSQFLRTYSSEPRRTGMDKWHLSKLPPGAEFKVISDAQASWLKSDLISKICMPEKDKHKYFYVYATLGEVNSLEYAVRITGLAQRGNVIEIKVSLNSPEKQVSLPGKRVYKPEDIVRIAKSELPVTGLLHFIFKNQDGKELFKTKCIIK